MRFALACAACLALNLTAHAQTHGTAVIILATQDTIVVAADSKVTAVTAAGEDSAVTVGPGPRALHPCKILQVDDSTFVAIQGYRSTAETTMTDRRRGWTLKNGGSHPDFLKEVRDAMRRETGLMKDRFSRALRPLAEYRFADETVREARTRNPGEPLVLMQLVCFGRDAGELMIVQWRKFEDQVEGPSALEIPPRRLQRGILGSVQEKLVPWIEAHPEAVRGRGLVAQAKTLMEEAFRLDPRTSGPPMDVLCITRTGHEWIERKSFCE